MQNSIRSAIVLLMLCGCAFANDLTVKLEQRIKEYNAETIGVYYEDHAGHKYSYNPDIVMHAASTMKVPVMMEVFRLVESGKLQLDRAIPVKNEFASIIDASPFSLTKEDDSDQELYSHIGETMP